MWIVAKINLKEKNIFEKELKVFLGKDAICYSPYINVVRKFKNKDVLYKKSILEGYVFCHHKNFKEKNLIQNLKYLKGLNFFLDKCDLNQEGILKFVECCKSFEDKKGSITSNFFKKIISNKGVFLSGPFKNLIFDILEKQKNKLKILIEGLEVTVKDKDYLYCPV